MLSYEEWKEKHVDLSCNNLKDLRAVFKLDEKATLERLDMITMNLYKHYVIKSTTERLDYENRKISLRCTGCLYS